MVKKWLLKQAAKHLILEAKKPVKLSELTYAGVDENGKRYYTWESLDQIPRCRFLEIERTNMYIDNKISPTSLEQLTHAIDKLATEIVVEKNQDKKIRFGAQIHHLASEIRFRDQYAIPKTVFVSLAALLCIREDETPEEYSAKIQAEKADQFEKELDAGNAFFLKTPTFKKLIPSLIMSEEAFKIHLARLEVQEVKERERLKIILSKDESSSTKKAKTA